LMSAMTLRFEVLLSDEPAMFIFSDLAVAKHW